MVGHTESPICPVAALLEYIAARGDDPGALNITSVPTPHLSVFVCVCVFRSAPSADDAADSPQQTADC